MSNIRPTLNNLLNDDSGQDLIEYALIAGLISLGAIAAVMGSLLNQISNDYNTIGSSFSA